jgi:TolB-like protein/cytochrome c-type biogenesis protein CcmH/NrfG
VNCAVEIQREIAERNTELQYQRRMEFRIGINSGDVVEEGERIYGDGVNIGARVEGLAEGGGICISGNVHESIEGKLGLEFEYLGEHELKNIDKPIRVYRVLSFPGAAAHRVVKAKSAMKRRWQKAALAVAAMVIVVVGALAIWNFYFRPPPIEPASEEKMAYPLPDKPSIAVLPFVNMSDDPNQEYFSDGITEDLITDLSKISGLFVIARNSTFFYKGKNVKISQVAEELGTRYILEGSVRKADSRIRITAQLIDTITGGHLWAERYDRDWNINDIFTVQDEVIMKIIDILAVKLVGSEKERIFFTETENLEAYELVLRGWESFNKFSKEKNVQARQLFEEAVVLDPNYPSPYAGIVWTYIVESHYGWTHDPKVMEKAFTLAQKVLTLDKLSSDAYILFGNCYLFNGKHENAISEFNKALALDSNNSEALNYMALTLTFSGKHEEAIEYSQKAIRLNPNYPFLYMFSLGMAYFHLNRYDKAISALKKSLLLNPDFITAHMYLASSYGHLGKETETHAVFKEILKRYSGQYQMSQNAPFKNPEDPMQIGLGLYKSGWSAEALQSLVPDEVFKFKGPLAFTITYPGCYKQLKPRSEIEVFYALIPFGKTDFNIVVRDVRLGEKLEDYSELWINYLTKYKIGTDFNIISSEPTTLKDGTPAKLIVIKWWNLAGWPVESRILVAIKNNRLISFRVHGGSGEKIDKVSEYIFDSLRFN